MSSSALDLLDHPPPTKKLFDRRQSFKDIQGAISKMSPKAVKTVIESGKRPLTPSVYQLGLHSPSFPLSMPATAPLTIFYDGMVSTFNVSPSEAETVTKFALGEEAPTSPLHNQLHSLNQGFRLFGHEEKLKFDDSCMDLPIARKKSLQRFLKKRKGRMSLVSQ